MFRLYYSDRASSIDTAPIAEARGSLYTEFTQSHASSISSDEYSSHFKKLKFYFIDEKSVTDIRWWCHVWEVERKVWPSIGSLFQPRSQKKKRLNEAAKKKKKQQKFFFFKEWKDIKKSFPKTQNFHALHPVSAFTTNRRPRRTGGRFESWKKKIQQENYSMAMWISRE